MFCDLCVSAWSAPNKPPPVSDPDPWGQGDKPSGQQETGWADFSAASFSNFNASFSEEKAEIKRESDEKDSIETLAQGIQLAVDEGGLKKEEEKSKENVK